jgi:ankyrin repeat protein
MFTYGYPLIISHIVTPWYLTSCFSLLNQNGVTPLIAAAYQGHASVVTLLLNANADVNHADQVRRHSTENV